MEALWLRVDGFSTVRSVNFISVTFINVCALLWVFVVILGASCSEIAVTEGGYINLSCTLNGSNISWRSGEENLHNGRNFSKQLTRNESGIYECHDSNNSSKQYNVTVQYGAEGTISTNVTKFFPGDLINISCKVVGVPPVSQVVWIFNNKSIQISNTSCLIYKPASCSLQGKYICCPKNNISNAQNGTTVVQVEGCQSTESISGFPATSSTPATAQSKVVPIVLGIFGGILLVLVAVGGYRLLRRRRYQCCCSVYCNGFFSVESEPSPPSPTGRKTSLTKISKLKHGPIHVDSFAAHVKLMHTDGDYRFNQEFEELKSVHIRSKVWSHSEKPENQSKNRYGNIVAYDHSRVILSSTESEPDSHYINANYVDSFEKVKAYIATQGPLANTINDFWRMVWEENCRVIVMITNIYERGRNKCAKYWPSKDTKSEVHGPLMVTCLDEECFAHYNVRRFEVKPVDHCSHYSQDAAEDEVKPMEVVQYHFTGWPDHGAPDVGCEYPALDFILKSAAANQDGAGPVIVHCSAGVGRSGAYIVIHSMVTRMHERRDINVFDFVAQIRQQRNHLVQEECQYIFVHDALQHYIDCDMRLSIPVDELKGSVQRLRKNLSNKSKLEVEFENLNAIQVRHYNLKQAKRGCNIAKNRSVDYIPADSARVELYPRPREEGSDYINATYLAGFWKSQAYIATQYPLEETTQDFWRMVWQENCRSLVMLLSKTELEQDCYHSYLPPAYETCRFGEYEVTIDSENTRGDIVVRELRMVSIKDPSEYRNLQHFHFLHWPEDGAPWSGQTILQLICKVDSWEKEVQVHAKPHEFLGPILVHCNSGVGRTGVYCLLHTMFHQIRREQSVSIYQIARLYNHQRPHCILTKEQYEFCYDTLVEYIEADCSLHLV